MEVVGLVCGMPSSAGDVELRFHTAALVNLNPGQNYVRLAFEVRCSMYSGSVRLDPISVPSEKAHARMLPSDVALIAVSTSAVEAWGAAGALNSRPT